MYGATTVPMKESMGQFALDKALELIAEAGDANQRIMVKTDQEASVKALIEDLVAQREEGRTIVEENKSSEEQLGQRSGGEGRAEFGGPDPHSTHGPRRQSREANRPSRSRGDFHSRIRGVYSEQT